MLRSWLTSIAASGKAYTYPTEDDDGYTDLPPATPSQPPEGHKGFGEEVVTREISETIFHRAHSTPLVGSSCDVLPERGPALALRLAPRGPAKSSYTLQRALFGAHTTAVPPPQNVNKPSGTPLCVKGPNILVLGAQQAGKSSLVNTYRRAVTGHDGWAQAPVGRSMLRGTTSLEPYMPRIVSGGNEVPFVILDTAGRRLMPLEPNDVTSEDAKVYLKILQGTAWKQSMVDASTFLENSNDVVVAENAVDHVFIVLSAEDIVYDKGFTYTSFWSSQRYACTLEHVSYLASLFAWFERRLVVPPYVIVTYMDKVFNGAESLLRDELGSLVHKNRIFFVANPDDLSAISRKTTKALRKLHENVIADVKARDATAGRSIVKKRF